MKDIDSAIAELMRDIDQMDRPEELTVDEEVERLRAAAAAQQDDMPPLASEVDPDEEEEQPAPEVPADDEDVDILIRSATPLDTAALLSMLAQANREQAVDVWRPTFDPYAALVALANFLQSREAGTGNEALIAELDGRIAGTLGVWPMKKAWAPSTPVMGDEWFYVMPWARRHGVADGLLQAAEAVADAARMPLRIHLWTGTDVEAKERYLRRRGYQYIGGDFLRVPHVEQARADD